VVHFDSPEAFTNAVRDFLIKHAGSMAGKPEQSTPAVATCFSQ
jgi:hypothetical protein